ncbi:MAG: hypothetical protein SF172_10805 [Burkholderiales bacterium]|nr:hypothetical protein [Burkholderiales bacterium]
MNNWFRLLIPCGALLVAGCAAVPASGPDVVSAHARISTAAGPTEAVRYTPTARSPRGVLVFVHGFLRGPARHASLAQRLAREGYVVVLPDLPSPLTYGARERDVALVDAWVASAVSSSPDATPLFIGGFSRGSGIALEVAARLDASLAQRLAGVMLIDPVAPRRAVQPLLVPVALIAAPTAGCNARGMSFEPIRTTLRPEVDVTVAGANHCEAESPSDLFCAVLCGPPDAGRQAEFEDAMVAFILAQTRPR